MQEAAWATVMMGNGGSRLIGDAWTAPRMVRATSMLGVIASDVVCPRAAFVDFYPWRGTEEVKQGGSQHVRVTTRA
jgi:hypothetical protein